MSDMAIPDKFLKPYNPSSSEEPTYTKWEESGYFNPDNLPGDRKEPFSIVLPPPNVTGTLHLGHAVMLAIEDILVRFERMRGKKVLWIPGTDHAAIATETKFLKESKIRRSDYADKRTEFIKLVNDYAMKNQEVIKKQLRAMGASLDWTRLRYTLDDECSNAVQEAFIRMHDAGLIYMGKGKVVNWDPKGQTVVSDDEIEYESGKAILYTFHYSKEFPIPVSTTRLETKVGDTAVAVHPDDDRYKQYIGKIYKVDFVGSKLSIKIIGDPVVDPAFGTGALGVTPAHSQTDEEVASRHGLPSIQVINEFGKMRDNLDPLIANKKTTEAREIIATYLKEKGLLQKEEIIDQNISKAQRSGGIIEPLPKRHQFFVKVDYPIPERSNKTLKELMREVITSGKIKILPERFEKIYLNWINNLRDWSISRQIWYGHRLPIWYKPPTPAGDDLDYVVSKTKPGEGWEQFTDTLDTWFSSGLWTFSTLGWPTKTDDLKTFHPTSVLETGYDILFFWVARMILMSSFHTGEIPFKNVYLHGLVRDEKGRKMSKSLGNVIDPLDMIKKYGTDAVRLSLVVGAAPGNDIKISERIIGGYKNFANKIWNITRFVLESYDKSILTAELTENDKKLLQEAMDVAVDVTKHIETFRLDLAANSAYHYIWDRFAAHILEDSKLLLKDGFDVKRDEKIFESAHVSKNPATIASKRRVLFEIWTVCLKFLHPFMPFVTEEIWSSMPHNTNGQLLMIEEWPVPQNTTSQGN